MCADEWNCHIVHASYFLVSSCLSFLRFISIMSSSWILRTIWNPFLAPNNLCSVDLHTSTVRRQNMQTNKVEYWKKSVGKIFFLRNSDTWAASAISVVLTLLWRIMGISLTCKSAWSDNNTPFVRLSEKMIHNKEMLRNSGNWTRSKSDYTELDMNPTLVQKSVYTVWTVGYHNVIHELSVWMTKTTAHISRSWSMYPMGRMLHSSCLLVKTGVNATEANLVTCIRNTVQYHTTKGSSTSTKFEMPSKQHKHNRNTVDPQHFVHFPEKSNEYSEQNDSITQIEISILSVNRAECCIPLNPCANLRVGAQMKICKGKNSASRHSLAVHFTHHTSSYGMHLALPKSTP